LAIEVGMMGNFLKEGLAARVSSITHTSAPRTIGQEEPDWQV